jgi:hypothetical protein
VEAIFYIGKGKNMRPYSHLLEALKEMRKKEKKTLVKTL